MWRRLVSVICLVGLILGASFAARRVRQSQEQAAPQTLADMAIQEAWYGDPGGSGVDVTPDVKSIFRKSDSLHAASGIFSDPAQGRPKILWVRYTVKGEPRQISIAEGSTIAFSSLLGDMPKAGSFQLLSANYQGANVLPQMQRFLDRGESGIPISPAVMGVDPAMGSQKTLTLTFKLEDGDERVLSGHDGDEIFLQGLVPLKVLKAVRNGSFESTDTSGFSSANTYVAAGENVLSRSGTYTISQGILRPFQLERSIRADFVEHTGKGNSMAMWINPLPGRQPVLLWEEKVAIQPGTDYVFSCFAADVSDSQSLYGTIMLEVDGAKSEPVVLDELFAWKPIMMKLHTRTGGSAHLKIWRDVIPYNASGPAALGLDDIRFGATR